MFHHMFLYTHRIACVFTQLFFLVRRRRGGRGRVHRQFLEARRSQRRALLLVRDELRHRELGAAARRQLRLAPRGSGGCTGGVQQRLHAGAAGPGSRVAAKGCVPFKSCRCGAQIGLRRRKHAVQLFLFPLKHPQSRFFLAALRAPGATTLRTQFRAEPWLGFLLEILPHPALVGLLSFAVVLRRFLLHGACAAAGQPERTLNQRRDVTVGLRRLGGHFH